METERPKGRETYMDMVVDWSLAHEVESTRQSIIKRARSLAERLERLATGLELDGDYTLNSIGELQGNGVELDTWCTKYAFARDTLRCFGTRWTKTPRRRARDNLHPVTRIEPPRRL